MSKNQLAGLGAALVIAAGATTAVLWPGGPAPISQPAPAGTVLAQGAVEVCDTSDGGSGQCAVCEAVLAYDSAPDAGGTVAAIVRTIECGYPYDPGSDIAMPGPIMFGMGAIGHGNIHGGGVVQQTTQARIATASPAVSALDPASLGCACARVGGSDCQWQGPDDPQGNTPDPVPCPVGLTMRPGTCSGGDCVPTFCWETEQREKCGGAGCQMAAECK